MIAGTVLKFAIDSSSVQGQHHQDEMHLLFNLILFAFAVYLLFKKFCAIYSTTPSGYK